MCPISCTHHFGVIVGARCSIDGMNTSDMKSQIERPYGMAIASAPCHVPIMLRIRGNVYSAATKRPDQKSATQMCMQIPASAHRTPPLMTPGPNATLATPLNTRNGVAVGGISNPVAEANRPSLSAATRPVAIQSDTKVDRVSLAIIVAVMKAVPEWPPLSYLVLRMIFAGFCGSIIRCAHGVPGYITHGPPSTGTSENPVDLKVAFGV